MKTGSLLHQFLHVLESGVDHGSVFLRRVFGSRLPVRIVVYDGHANCRHAILRGRVLRERAFPLAKAGDSAWVNFRRIFSLFLSHEVPGAQVRIHYADLSADAVADGEGYFLADLDLRGRSLPNQAWHEFQVECLEPWCEGKFGGRFRTPGPEAEFGVISDIDDTVMETGATRLWFMVTTTLFGNVHTRTIFPGTPAFFDALAAGTDGTAANPLFYVTSSPWNLHDLVTQIFVLRGVPRGPMFMSDWGIDRSKLFKSGHGEHKLAAIRSILETYPDLAFLLVGDSGERDPEIYSQILKEFPGRIRAIYIRDVTPDVRDADVDRLSQLAADCCGVELIRCANSLVAAEHAAKAGFIRHDAVASVAQNCTE